MIKIIVILSLLSLPFFYAFDQVIIPGRPGVYKAPQVESIMDFISEKYRRGSNLIYDCAGKYYACVDKTGFDVCQSERNYKRRVGKNFYKKFCAPLKRLTTEEDCHRLQRQRVEQKHPKPFCIFEE